MEGADNVDRGQRGLRRSEKGSDRCRTRVKAVSCSGRDWKAHIIFAVFAKVFKSLGHITVLYMETSESHLLRFSEFL